jgi:mono/diheme cytochrome c family protein
MNLAPKLIWLPVAAMCVSATMCWSKTNPSVAAQPIDGKRVFASQCAACHAPGPRMPGTAALAAKYGKDLPAALEERTDLTPDLVRQFVRHGVSVMPSFRKTEISDAELDALGRYLSNPKRR